MSQQSEDMNVATDELSQLRLKELVKRPGYGTVGKPIKLACNYFPLIKLQKGDIVVNRYHIDIQHPRLKLNWFDFNMFLFSVGVMTIVNILGIRGEAFRYFW
ncbi:eukaryotic translation initiation factor 2C 1 [Trichinella spiralis]|uniref:eukaryotic translation initiation factor 2C 1 n=1 Tax=Trichinella spiralis TaxID=6334 RepID=UPI0001EFEBEE|nr:eukaryotic translation initiation factor 2C 1 [Trichinella spiralis]